jgi:hypothetical protein
VTERPFIQIHIGGFLASTMCLSTEEIGAYSLLLLTAWRQGGTLPADMRALARVVRLSPAKWSAMWPVLEGYFDIVDSRLIPRAYEEWRRAKLRIYGRTPLSLALRAQIMERDGAVCIYCGCTDGPFHIDHVQPVARGGTDDPSNLVVACAFCNMSKGPKSLEEWRG